MADLETRPATSNDLDFAWQVYAANVKPLIAPLMARAWVDDDEKKRFVTTWKTTDTHVILLDGVQIGWFSCDIGGNQVVVDHGYLLPPYQKQGVGAIILNFIVEEARKSNKTVKLSTLRTNPAVEFFKKQGCTITEVSDIHCDVNVTAAPGRLV